MSKRQLRERIRNKEYQRLDDKTKLKLINKEEVNVSDFIKNPIVIKNKYNYDIENISEKMLQRLILEDIPSFLKELGDGFSFIENEYKIKIGDIYNYIDLLLFNIKYNCYVVIELKVCKLKKAEYMRRRIGEVHEGIISGVTNWGIYVELPNTIEGMVHVSILPGDYYYYDEKTYSMVGERTGRTFKLGEKATIRVKDVDMMLKNIDFELVEDDDYEQSEDGWN